MELSTEDFGKIMISLKEGRNRRTVRNTRGSFWIGKRMVGVSGPMEVKDMKEALRKENSMGEENTRKRMDR